MLHNRLAKLREERANGEHGFTLIELLVVVVIIGILIAIAIPLYLNYRRGANDKSAQSDLRGGINTLEQCNTDNQLYPASLTASPAAPAAPTSYTACSGQSINVSSGTTMNYTPNTGKTSYVLVSTNSNGSGKLYCYNSATGGAVKDVSSGKDSSNNAYTLTTATC